MPPKGKENAIKPRVCCNYLNRKRHSPQHSLGRRKLHDEIALNMHFSLRTLALFQYIIAFSTAPIAAAAPGWWSRGQISRLRPSSLQIFTRIRQQRSPPHRYQAILASLQSQEIRDVVGLQPDGLRVKIAFSKLRSHLPLAQIENRMLFAEHDF